jgi:Ferric reductase like transmembrane component
VLALNSQALWYLTRGTGVISLMLLTVSVALGVSEVVRFASPGWPRFVLAALHRNIALLATAFVAVHVLTAILDSFAPIRIVDVLVPFLGKYRPMWLGLGAVAFDLLVAVIVTSLMRERIGHRAWRVVHWAAYACWPVALVHGLGTGSDTRFRWAVAVNVGCLLMVLAAVLFRLGWTRTVSIGSRVVSAGASIAIALAVVGWMVVEPMRAGWARKAGTPSTLLATSGSIAGRSGNDRAVSIPIPFSSAARGTISESGGVQGQRATVAIDVALPGARGARLRVVIVGTALDGGGVRMDNGTVQLGPAGTPDLYRGVVTSLSGTNVAATASGRDGTRISLAMEFQLGDGNAIAGTVSARSGGSDGN